MKIKWDGAELRKLERDIAAKVQRADKAIRSQAHGKPVDEVVPIAKRGLASIGINLPESSLREYSEHVAAGKDFKFVLK